MSNAQNLLINLIMRLTKEGGDPVATLAAIKEATAELGAATEKTMAVGAVPPKLIDTEEFKNQAGLIDSQAEKLQNFKEAAGGIRLAAAGGPTALIGLTRAIEGVGKAAGLSKEQLSGLIGKLGAAGAGFAIGDAIGDAVFKNIISPIWDAVDAYEAMHDPAKQAFEDAKAARRALIELNNERMEKVQAAIKSNADAMARLRQEVEDTASAMKELDAANAEVATASVTAEEKSGKITSEEADRRRAQIDHAQKQKALQEELAAAQIKLLQEEQTAGAPGGARYEAQQKRVQAVQQRIAAENISYSASQTVPKPETPKPEEPTADERTPREKLGGAASRSAARYKGRTFTSPDIVNATRDQDLREISEGIKQGFKADEIAAAVQSTGTIFLMSQKKLAELIQGGQDDLQRQIDQGKGRQKHSRD